LNVELGVGTAVEGARCDNLIAGPKQRGQSDVLSGEARADRHRADPAFERRDALFEGGGGGVHDPRVDISEPLKRKQLSGVVCVLEHVGGCLVDRHRP
jgi:hypothetical protein